jgi:O-antigen/teichoic acid export membrane protein
MERIKLIKKIFQENYLATLSQIINISLALIITLIITRSIPIEQFGIFTLFITITVVSAIFMDLGLGESSAQYIGEVKDNKLSHQIMGITFLYSLYIGVAYSSILLVFSFFLDLVFQVKTGFLFREYWIYLGAIPVYELSKTMSKGTGRLGQWSIINILPRLFFLIGLLIISQKGNIHLSLIIFVFAISYIISVIINLFILKPSFNFDAVTKHEIRTRVRTFGFKVMLSNLVFNANVSLDKLLISVLLTSQILGVYQFAVMVSNPIVVFSRSLGVSGFSKFIHQDRIPPQVHSTNLFALLIQGILLYILFPIFLSLLGLEKYIVAHQYLPFILVAHVFLGLKQPYSFYFIAHKWGDDILKISIFTLVTSFIFYLAGIYLLGIYGALLGLVYSYLILWLLLVFRYNKNLKSNLT